MTFVADENIDRQIVEKLRSHRHSVIYIIELERAIKDEQVLELSRRQDAVLLTADKDFGELVFRQRLIHSGILLVHLQGLPSSEKADIVERVVRSHSLELKSAFAVISKHSIRIRRPIV